MPSFENTLRRLSLLAFTVAITGCTVGPDYRSPIVPIPGAFGRLPTTHPTPAAKPIDLARWWETLHDPELNSLLDRAEKNNLDLEAAVDRLQEARAAEAVFVGTSLPSLKFSGDMGVGTGTSQARGGQVDGPLNAATDTQGLRQITHVLGVDTQWEADVFGHLRREAQAVVADTAAAGEFRNQVLVTLCADVARSYALVRTLEHRLAIARGVLASQQRASDFQHIRFQRGIINELDVQLADRELAGTRATIEPLHAALLNAERHVAVLLGEDPGDLIAELDRAGTFPVAPAELQSGLPADLLRRRPDVRQAEAQLIAANARLGMAVSNLYPRFFLNAAAGEQGQGINRTPIDWRFIWSVGPTVTFPLLDFGQADAQIQQQDQATRERLVNYRKVVLTAIEEVDDALTDYDAERSRLGALGDAVAAAHRALDIANQRYDRGLTDYLNVLDAERALANLQDQQAVSQDQTMVNFVRVCQSLGGGWQGYAPPPPLRQPLPALLALGRDMTGK